ncbi:hypothetical protein [Vibrio breoganii]|uniref:hypothetical protein n=1 Tax=Vibrio breoganii TaxID=553239 RepID=UPI000C843F2D|nr:hypothetical protein [Vibrio breoganii]PMG89968.1 hypothetical protein BCU79_18230 [Vibrio breoganii]PMJ48022.1 hypothetical protein BCU21_04920 [Vibrio breoganii]PMK57704.1 hypothetical protein BCT97_09945 [Vibrio breoganii]PMM79572.1 hypothetical protein BCT44_15025 [Vibrio breoganii]PMO27168.1 hypothetical protein BCT14_13455 [Vibrio breoganii]
MPKVNFFYAGGEYCFKKHGFTTHYNPDFISTLCAIPSSIKNKSKSTVDGYWIGIRLFLTMLQDKHLPLFDCLSINHSSLRPALGSHSEWQNALSVFRDHVDALDKSNSLKNTYLGGAYFWMERLAHDNHIPRLSPVKSFGSAKKNTHTTPQTVMDAPISEHVKQSILGVAPDTNFDDIQTVYQHVLLELAEIVDTPEGFHSLPISEQVEWVLSRRLSKVRVAIDRSIRHQLDVRKEGLKAIREHRHLIELFENYLSFNKGKGYRNPWKPEVTALTYEQCRNGLLSWFWYKNKRLQLKEHDGKRYIAATKVLNEIRLREKLPSDIYKWSDLWFANRLGLTSEMYTPCILLLIFDNYMNVSNARKITVNSLDQGDGVATISWYKKRAESWLVKTVSNELEISSSTVFKCVKRATAPYRRICAENKYKDQHDFLFLSYHSSTKARESGVRPLNPESGTFTNHAKAFLASVSENKWYMTPDMLRSSLLLLSGFKGGIGEIQHDAQHKHNRTSTIYHNRPAARATFHEEMREFKEWMQVLITMNIDDAPLKLGVDPSLYEERKQQILSSRFGGLYCKDPKAGLQAGTVKGKSCNKIARCILCKNKKNLFIESVENITHLLQWSEALEKAVAEGLIDAENNINWYFWFRFIEEMIARLENNRVSKARNQALIADAKEQISKRENPYLAIDFKEVT